jgi:(4S)-4-hydroxy-5-phosphonooxypentane-2,3-dione isomerase
MYVVCVQVKVKPEHVDDFIRVTRANYDGTRGTEAGNVRWDFSQAEDDPTRFFIYEVYRTKADFPAHQQTEHYLKWKDTVADWMAEPRVGTKYINLYPSDESWDK